MGLGLLLQKKQTTYFVLCGPGPIGLITISITLYEKLITELARYLEK